MENENKSSRSGATLKKINPKDLVVGQKYLVEMTFEEARGKLYPFRFSGADKCEVGFSKDQPIYTIEESADIEESNDIELEMLVNVATALYVAHGTNADAVKTFMPDREQIAREALELITACKRAIKNPALNKSDVSGSLQAEAIEFAEWIRTFDSLEKKQGFWIIESQISSENLYKGFLKDRERWRNDH